VEEDFRKFYNFKSIRFTKQETEMMSLMNEVFTVILPSNDGIISLYYDPEMTLLRVLQTVVAQRSYYNVENYELSLEENDKNFLDPMKKMKDIRKKNIHLVDKRRALSPVATPIGIDTIGFFLKKYKNFKKK